MTTSSALNAHRRTSELEQLGDGEVIDLLVIGGGVTGVGIALDAASRGLSTVLVEREDLAFGTSRWSSKLVHGGLRYLASGNVGIAHESAVERGILMEHTAPHLVHALPQLVPMLPNVPLLSKSMVRAGFVAGDVLRRTAGTSPSSLPRSRRVSRAEALRYAPTVRDAGLRGGIVAWDGQLVDDARLVVGIARTAASFGAKILTRVAASDVTGTSATLHDTRTGSEIAVTARAVVNAAGVWAGEVNPEITLRPSRGSHLVFATESFGGLGASLTVPVPGKVGRFVFAFPAAHGRVYLGLTDEAAPGPVPDVPVATDSEIDFLLDTINTVLREPLTRKDILGTYAGLRPLLDTGDGNTADLSRDHAVLRAANGLITVVGGKLTTYRKMAEDAVDAAVTDGRLTAGPCLTKRLPLVGAAKGAARDRIVAPQLLIGRYGTEAPLVVAAAQGNSSLLSPIAPGLDVSAAEFAFGISHEGALTPDDLLDRRTRIGMVESDRDLALPAAEAAFG
ncbi:glycerol-3-phosphate dehydrogenase/oxidase [Antrihabitans cavernicola]|uniref:Glycerol-3-phosphate dehydrogenase n=1 Tax=Antrihabitans cavernicola TaxID=2495913 RepID=A0A5A7SC58_9NOCA|nr:glycerol-3-phosphate dehydrogenase/oxidase [Spelaeibacter cavernicola]KAA0022929.1 glycerol-3-phosphate dehydrogenase/oxidase [Spelaeibacter cavernicola]